MGKSILLGVPSVVAFAAAIFLLVYKGKESCDGEKRIWCGEPTPRDTAFVLIAVGAGLQVLKCLLC